MSGSSSTIRMERAADITARINSGEKAQTAYFAITARRAASASSVTENGFGRNATFSMSIDFLKLLLGISRHEQDLEFGPALARLADHRRSVHARHDDVADQKVDRLALGEDLKRILAIVGGDHRIAMPGERPFGDAPDHRLILDQQDRAAAPQFVLLGFLELCASARRLLPRGGPADR